MSRKKFSLDRRARRFCLEIQPTSLSECLSICARGFASELSSIPVAFMIRGDHANRVLRHGKRDGYLSGNHSSIRGSERAQALNPEWLMLADADVIHDPATIANLARIASQDHYDLVSFMVKLHCESLAERLLIPAFVYFFFTVKVCDGTRLSRT